MKDLSDEEKHDRVVRILRSMRGFDALVSTITSPQLRRSLYGALRERFDMVAVPDPTTDEMFTKVLASASIGILPLRETDPKFTETVGLITEALRLAARAPLVAPPSTEPVRSAPAQGITPTIPVPRPEKPHNPTVVTPQGSPFPVTASDPYRLFANLPEERKTGRRLDPLTLLFPGPARDGKIGEMTDWISGKPWAPDVLALRLAPTDPSAIEEIADLEAEGFSAPKTLRDRSGVRPWMESEGRERSISWLRGAGRDLGVYAITVDKAMTLFRDRLEQVIETYWPAQVPSLAAFGARLVPGEDVPELLADAWDIETFFLREAKDEENRVKQDVRGSFLPHGALVPGLCFERAAYLFLSSGRSLPAVLIESLVEMRHAQVARDLEPDMAWRVSQGFDAVFFSDCARPIEDYKLGLGVTHPSPDPMPEF